MLCDKLTYSKPIVDLILYLAAKNPFHRIETKLLEYGTQVDEDTCKNYAIKFQDKVKKYAKITVLEKNVGINLLKLLREKYQNFVADGNFIGATATNAMEGGN